MKTRSVPRWVFGPLLAAGAAVLFGRARFERATARRVETLLEGATLEADGTVREEELVDLPPPVERYFDAVLTDGRPYVHSVRLEQRGEFRLGDRSGSWKPLRAVQHCTVEPPGFVWDATIRIAPLLSVRVVDAYERGEGSLHAKLLSAIPVTEAEPGSEMNEGELLRYLGEAVWFPTALLPSAGVEWERVDDRTARATIVDCGNTASLVFHFDDEGLVERVTAERRYRQEDDGFAPWTGHFAEYQWYGGMRIPTRASVEWNLPDGDFVYWRADVVVLDYGY